MATKSREPRRNGRVKKKEPKKDVMGGALGKSVKAPVVGKLPSKLLNMQVSVFEQILPREIKLTGSL